MSIYKIFAIMETKLFLPIFCIIILLACSFAEDRTLKLVHLVFRHGDRAAINTYPTDPNKESVWPNGLAQLTERGMRMEYTLGQSIRQIYVTKKTFLKPSYDRSEIYIRSSTTDRCLVSALSQLAGLYPPQGHQVWNKDINWQPIPVHSVPKTEDTFFEMGAYDCPNLARAYHKWFKSEEYVKLNNENQGLFRKLSNFSGMEITSVDDSWRLADTLYTETVHNLTIPTWVPPIIDQLNKVFHWGFVHKFAGSTTRSSLNAGVLLNDVLSHMKTLTDGTSHDLKKMYLYSGHDDNVLPFLASINVLTHQPPPYAAAGIVELYEDKNKQYTVDVLYRNDSTKLPYKLPIQGCPYPCKFKDFLKIVESRAIANIDKACGVRDSKFDELWRNHAALFIGTIIVTVLFIVVLTVCLLQAVRRRSRKHLRRWDLADIDNGSDNQYLVK